MILRIFLGMKIVYLELNYKFNNILFILYLVVFIFFFKILIIYNKWKVLYINYKILNWKGKLKLVNRKISFYSKY